MIINLIAACISKVYTALSIIINNSHIFVIPDLSIFLNDSSANYLPCIEVAMHQHIINLSIFISKQMNCNGYRIATV